MGSPTQDLLLLAELAELVAVVELHPPTPEQPHPVRIERVMQNDRAVRWAVRHLGHVLNTEGRWDVEPLPSSRTTGWLKRHRFTSFSAAYQAARVHDET